MPAAGPMTTAMVVNDLHDSPFDSTEGILMVAWRTPDRFILSLQAGTASVEAGAEELTRGADRLFRTPGWQHRPLLTSLAARRVHLGLLPCDDALAVLESGAMEALSAMSMRPEKGKLAMLDRLKWQSLYYDDIALLDDILRLRALPDVFDQPLMSLDEALALSRWPDAGLTVFSDELAANRTTETTWSAVMAGRRLLAMVRRHPLVTPDHYRSCLDFLVNADEITRVIGRLEAVPDASGRLPTIEPPRWLAGASPVTELETIRALLKEARLPLAASLARLAWVDSGLFRWTTPELHLYALLDGPMLDEPELVSLDVVAIQRGHLPTDEAVALARQAVQGLRSPAPSPDSLVLLSADRRQRRKIPLD
jgi:hypothetical protein